MIERVKLEDREVVLLGTAHVSGESVDEVSRVLEEEKPDAVCVELDEKRYESLRDKKGWEDKDVTEALEEGKGSLLLVNVLLSIYQRKLGESLQVEPGSEMLEAVEEAEERGTEFHLVDRDISDTVSSAVDGLTFLEKFRLAYYSLASFFEDGEVSEEDIEELKERDALEAVVEELGGEFPSLKRAFLDERDHHMAERIREVEADRIVAVLGAAHVKGVAEILREGTEAEVEDKKPGRSIPWGKAVSYGVPAAIVGMFLYIFAFVGLDAGRDAFVFWFLINGSLAGVGALISRSHPLTAVISFLAAPFTSINPALPSGLVAAYTENRVRPPKVGDLEAVGQVSRFSDLWENTALKLLLIFFMVNLGSSIGS
ncbi:MAG: TraB/GumN family protein, partial [Candidatus Nanohaloarchaea archaeon]